MQKSSVQLNKEKISKAEKEVKKVVVKKEKSKIESEITRIIHDLAATSDKNKTDFKLVKIESVVEPSITLDNKKTEKVILIYLNYSSIKVLPKIADLLINKIEEKTKQRCLITLKRKIESKHLKVNKTQMRPRNRTLTSVYDSILEDFLLPEIIVGKRMRYRADGSSFCKILLNKDCESSFSKKADIVKKIYQKLTNRIISFEYVEDVKFYSIKEENKSNKKVHKK